MSHFLLPRLLILFLKKSLSTPSIWQQPSNQKCLSFKHALLSEVIICALCTYDDLDRFWQSHCLFHCGLQKDIRDFRRCCLSTNIIIYWWYFLTTGRAASVISLQQFTLLERQRDKSKERCRQSPVLHFHIPYLTISYLLKWYQKQNIISHVILLRLSPLPKENLLNRAKCVI